MIDSNFLCNLINIYFKLYWWLQLSSFIMKPILMLHVTVYCRSVQRWTRILRVCHETLVTFLLNITTVVFVYCQPLMFQSVVFFSFRACTIDYFNKCSKLSTAISLDPPFHVKLLSLHVSLLSFTKYMLAFMNFTYWWCICLFFLHALYTKFIYKSNYRKTLPLPKHTFC